MTICANDVLGYTVIFYLKTISGFISAFKYVVSSAILVSFSSVTGIKVVNYTSFMRTLIFSIYTASCCNNTKKGQSFMCGRVLQVSHMILAFVLHAACLYCYFTQSKVKHSCQ